MRQTLHLTKQAGTLVIETKLARSNIVGLIKDPQFGSVLMFGLGSRTGRGIIGLFLRIEDQERQVCTELWLLQGHRGPVSTLD